MIEKMKFLSITGPKADIDRMTETYLSKYEIHLENALSELTEVANLSPFLEINPYREALTSINSFYEQLDAQKDGYRNRCLCGPKAPERIRPSC